MLPDNVSKALEEKHRQEVLVFLSTSANDHVFAFMQHVLITFFQMVGILYMSTICTLVATVYQRGKGKPTFYKLFLWLAVLPAWFSALGQKQTQNWKENGRGNHC